MPRAPFGSQVPCHRLLAGVVVLACAWPHPASAQQGPIEPPALLTASFAALLSTPGPFGPSVQPRVGTNAPLDVEPFEPGPLRRPAALPALYVSFAVLQALDAHSTLTGVSAGGREVNPAIAGLVDQPVSFVGAKVAATAGTLFLTERLWKKHRLAAVVLMVAVNATYAAIVAHNYRGRR
jgi:Domain of unknown function (DUF5658)